MAVQERISYRRYIIPLGFVFCCLFFVGVSSAKMLNTSPIVKTGEVQVAEWNVDVSLTGSSNMTLDAGSNSQSYSLVVTNDSEIASTYAIKVSNIPDGVNVGLDISSEGDLATPVNGEIVFTNTGGDLLPSGNRPHTLTLAAEATANATESGANMAIEVIFTQKDPQL